MRETNHAPGRLELVRDFVNSLDIEEQTDALATPEAAGAWLRAHQLSGGADLKPAELERLVSVREALRELLAAHTSGDPAPIEAVNALNDGLEGVTLGLRFEPREASLTPVCEGVDAALAELVAVIHAAIGDGTWERLKVCPTPDCKWAFYDRSRNRSATWCQMGQCGNRNKARAFRARSRTSKAGGPPGNPSGDQ